jgi:uncharacterized iron-regulated protein
MPFLRLPRPLMLSALALCACAALPIPQITTADVLLLGEQHDDPAHQRLHREAIETLASRGRLGAVALEMSEQGTSTAGLPPSADESAVRTALRWDDRAWPWAAYGPAIMAAVRAGAPVLGANLPRTRMRDAMADARLDTRLDAAALAVQQDAIRTGHCNLLPAAQIGPMTRIQIARDEAMASTLTGAYQPGKTVVLLAGAGHVDTEVGVPRHLPAALRVQAVAHPRDATAPGKNYCAEMKRQMTPVGVR